jgi:YidC/Oxa1 family membrane protein insertase
VVCAGAFAGPAHAASDIVRVATARLDLEFSMESASPVGWRACHPSCAAADAGTGTSIRFTGGGDPPQARLALRRDRATVDLERLAYVAQLGEGARGPRATFRADLPVEGVRLAKSFEVSRDGYEVEIALELSGPSAAPFMGGRRLELVIEEGRALHPAPAAGFAAMLDRVSRVIVSGAGVREIAGDRRASLRLAPSDWAGFHGRSWTILASADGENLLEPAVGALALRSDGAERLAWRYTLYSGPVERHALGRAAPVLQRLVLSGLWSWLRPLSLGLLWLLDGLTAIVRSPGLAVVALAVAVKLLLLPLAAVAERLQEQVNAAQSRLEPRIAEIRAGYRGEERARRTLAVYREEGVHPLYPLKSLAGLLIQLPVFVAVFDMLAEDFGLNGASFLWIRDLARPDELAQLPACAPFFGCYLNLLPFLMAGVSLAVLLRYRSPALSPALLRRQRRNLAGVTALFFFLFYTFPAGMVLYWTSTNAFQFARQELARLPLKTGWRWAARWRGRA